MDPQQLAAQQALDQGTEALASGDFEAAKAASVSLFSLPM